VGGYESDPGFTMTLDGANVVIGGWTRSWNLPATAGAYDETHNGEADLYVCRFDGVPTTAISDDPPTLSDRPGSVWLHDPEPNPTSGQVFYAIDVDRATAVRVSVFDVQGRLVASLMDGMLPAGAHRFSWAPDGGELPLANGTYYLRLDAEGEQRTCKFVVVR
jgi:hypothetical protein